MSVPAHEHVDSNETVTTTTAPRESRTTGLWAGMAVRMVLTLVGAAGMVVSALMDWVRGTAASDISVRGLWSTDFSRTGGNWLFTISAVMVGLGLLAIVGLAPRTGWLTSLAGALGIAVFVLLLVQASRADLGVSDMDAGAWIGLAGSVVALVGGLVGTRAETVSGSTPVVVAR
jgi:hypothetical protein